MDTQAAQRAPTIPSAADRWPQRDRRPPSRSLAGSALASGIAGVAVGLGIGARHLQVAGVSITAIVGLVALAVGLVSTTVGAMALIRRMRGWWRLLALPAGLLVVWFVVWPVTAALMATNVPPTRVGSQTPVDRGIAFEEVSFVSGDGVRLAAWYVPSRNGAAVVLRHGATETRSGTLDELVVLARHGYGVLATDARGHGRSEGVAMDWGWYGDLDIAAAVTYLAARPDVDADRIAAVGESMGGEEAIGAAATDPRIRAVVAEGASGRATVADDALILPSHPGRWMNVGQTWILQHITDLFTDAAPPLGLRAAVTAVAPRPVLLIVGSNALGGEATAGARMRAAAPRAVDLWRVPDAPHIGGLATQPQQWEARVIGFLDRALR